MGEFCHTHAHVNMPKYVSVLCCNTFANHCRYVSMPMLVFVATLHANRRIQAWYGYKRMRTSEGGGRITCNISARTLCRCTHFHATNMMFNRLHIILFCVFPEVDDKADGKKAYTKSDATTTLCVPKLVPSWGLFQ